MFDLISLKQETKWELLGLQPEKYLTFTNRETYLTWKTEWKLLYQHLSRAIRVLKAGRKLQPPKWFSNTEFESYKKLYGIPMANYFVDASVGRNSNTNRLAQALLIIRQMGKTRSIELMKKGKETQIQL